ncbi:MAG: nucleoside deaminase [Alphaproteobacteria bacterium]|nr:nucleoside deaminase [Alphaproteobacteria bacterium]
MQRALALAHAAAQQGEVPVGAVVVQGGVVVAAAHNLTETMHDPTAHAEVLALREAAHKLGTARLVEADVYVTLEPCAMCAAAISHARIRRLYFGAYDAKGGAIDHGPRWFTQPTCHHAPEVVGGMDEQQCAEVLRDFFERVRQEKKCGHDSQR